MTLMWKSFTFTSTKPQSVNTVFRNCPLQFSLTVSSNKLSDNYIIKQHLWVIYTFQHQSCHFKWSDLFFLSYLTSRSKELPSKWSHTVYSFQTGAKEFIRNIHDVNKSSQWWQTIGNKRSWIRQFTANSFNLNMHKSKVMRLLNYCSCIP